MPNRVPLREVALALCVAAILPACGSTNLWPFGGDAPERPRTPADATEYNCAGGKRFFVRLLEGGKSAWVMLPEREFRLDRADAGGASRYSNGISTLTLDDGVATLNDGSLTAFTGCRSGPLEPPKVSPKEAAQPAPKEAARGAPKEATPGNGGENPKKD